MDATAWATFWVFLALLVFIGGMFYLKVPGKIIEVLDGRADKIRNDIEEARKLREEAQALLADYQRRSSQVEQEAREIIDLAKREATVLAKEAKVRMEDYVVRRTRAVEQRIAQAETQALAEVRSRAVDVAAAAAASILAEKTVGADGDRLVDDAIATVKERLN
ncbi:MAG: F0F1 ATP synthase subunit B family protein [Alphaproteobacteria bacterium]